MSDWLAGGLVNYRAVIDQLALRVDHEHVGVVFAPVTWNTIAGTLLRDEPYSVSIERGDEGDLAGEEWARGFVLGMSLREDGWTRLIEDETFAVALVPMIPLAEATIAPQLRDFFSSHIRNRNTRRVYLEAVRSSPPSALSSSAIAPAAQLGNGGRRVVEHCLP